MAKRSGLGKGLDALFFDNNTEDGQAATLKISEIEPNRNQPRTTFEDEPLRELADSIREHGVLQPLVVRPLAAGNYQIVAGERRWRAARMAGLSELPVIIRELDDSGSLEIAIIENLQREDLNPIELAQGYRTLIDSHDMTQEQVAAKLGKSRSDVANTLRLLALPETVTPHVRSGKISKGHAKALLSLEDKSLIEQTAQKVVLDNILVRDIEKLGRESRLKKELEAQGGKPAEKRAAKVSAEDTARSETARFYKEMELALSEELGRRVTIHANGPKFGSIEIMFFSRDELEDIAAKLTK